MTTTFDNLPASGRAAILSLLSRVLVKEVDEALLVELGRDDVAAVLESLAPGVTAEVARAVKDEAAREALDVEYCRLFVLPHGVAPYAVAWAGGEEGATRADLQSRIGGLMDDLALRPAAHGLGNLPLDHVGVLLALAAVADARGEEDELRAAAFDLLRPWGLRFAAALDTASRSALYRAAARLLAAVLA